EKGFAIGPELALRLELYKHDIENTAKTNLSVIYAPSGKVLKENDILYRHNFSETLETISKNYSEFYEQKHWLNMKEDDFKNYKAKIREPLIGNYRGKKVPEGKETVKQHEDRIKEIMSKEYAASVRANISD
ncbi:35018_t:CDS:2, partial [Gigaspora margarita]